MNDYDLESYFHPSWTKALAEQRKAKQVITKEQLANNKFYVGSNSIFNRAGGNWGHKTIEEAVAHGEQLLASKTEDNQQIIIVQIVKVIRRKPIDTIIEDV